MRYGMVMAAPVKIPIGPFISEEKLTGMQVFYLCSAVGLAILIGVILGIGFGDIAFRNSL